MASNVAATKASRALVKNAHPHLKKVWKNYTYTRGLETRQLSPFEVDLTGSLIQGIRDNFVFRVVDNMWFWAPPTIFTVGSYMYISRLRADYLLGHRD